MASSHAPDATAQAVVEKLATMERGLTITQLAQRMGQSYGAAAHWANRFGYSYAKLRRGRKSTIDWDCADWSLPDAEIARRIGVSRERVRQVRSARGVPRTSARRQLCPAG